MRLFSKNRAFALCTFVLVCMVFAPQRAYAQLALVETQALNFGTIAIPNFAVVARVTIQVGGGFTSANVNVIIPPTRGEYTLTGGPPNTNYTVVAPASVLLTGPGGTFNFDNIQLRPLPFRTNGAGEDNIRVTGRLRSQGGGISYGDGAYTVNVPLTFAF